MSKTQTYFDLVRHIKPDDLPDDLKPLFEYVKEATDNHTTWEYCDRDPDVKRVVDGAIASIKKYLATVEDVKEKPAKARKQATAKPRGKSAEKEKPTPPPYNPSETFGYMGKQHGKFVILVPETHERWANEFFKSESEAREFCKLNNITLVGPRGNALPRLVPSIGVGLALVKRIHNMIGKKRTLAQVVNLLAAIQKAHEKGQLSKMGDEKEVYALLKWCESRFVHVLNTTFANQPLNTVIHVSAGDQRELPALVALALGTKQNPLVALILRFLGMQGKPVPMESAKRLVAAMKKQTQSGEFGKGSPQFTAIKSALDSLEDYVGGKRKTPKVSKETLNGLQGILAACKCRKCNTLNGLEPTGKELPPNWVPPAAPTGEPGNPAPPDNAPPKESPTPSRPQGSQIPSGFIIAPPVYKGRSNPITYASHRPLTSHVPTYNFNGRWQQLFNQPTKGFSALVYGQPKSGKSTMAIDLAGYLARGFGRVLYASIEEGGRSTLDERIRRLGVGHPNMDISNNLPADLSNYDFIITDSVSRGNLDLGQMQQLKADWPDKNFIFLFHTTKDGLPRGTNQFLHEVDVLVNVKDGVATADGRFGPGTMDVRFN